MPATRLTREQFFAKVRPLDAQRLRTLLWTVYCRGAAPLRERVEELLAPPAERRPKGPEPVDAGWLRSETAGFVELARSGAYIRSRLVSRKERSGWRFRFRALIDDACRAIAEGEAAAGVEALDRLLDLACECRDKMYFRSEDPIGAMRLVVSDRVRALWEGVLAAEGFAGLARRAPAQLIRWESEYGWSRDGNVAGETRLADVLGSLLHGLDAWIAFADAYLAALDALAPGPPAPDARGRRAAQGFGVERDDYVAERRAERLARWHDLLLDRLHGSEAEDRVDRLVAHAALGGPPRKFVAARLAHLRGDAGRARTLVRECLDRLPGHRGYAKFAMQIGAPLPRRAAEIFAEQDGPRRRAQRADPAPRDGGRLE